MLKSLLEISINKPVVYKANLIDYKIPSDIKVRLSKALNDSSYDFGSYTSFAITDREKKDKPANYAVIPNQYFIYAVEVYSLAIELFKYLNIFVDIKGYASKLIGNATEIESTIKSIPELSKNFDSDNDVLLFAKFIDKDDDTYRLGSKRLINDNGVPRGSKDCFGSVILKEVNLPDASSSIFGRLVYDLCSHMDIYRGLKGYIDKTKTANTVPNEIIVSESKIRTFVHKVLIYLIENNTHEKLFEKLNVEAKDDKKFAFLGDDQKKIYRLFKLSDVKLNESQLTSGITLRYFPEPFVYNSQYYYMTNQWADNAGASKNSRDIIVFAELFNNIYSTIYQINKCATGYDLTHINNTGSNLFLSKPFLLLAGISGTGKTRFVRKQAENNGDLASSYCLTAVRPDWHEPSDLLGYVSRLSGKSEYVVTDVLKFIVKSWLEIEQSGITLTKNSTTGSKAQQQQVKPFWLCLDEMNLAPVEQYFSDYLSVLETREWLWNDEAFTYQCDPLLKPSVFSDIEQDKLKKELGLEDHDDLWQHFLENGISIPFNLIVAGTVNMDETTHGFSRKVIDRALTFDFGEFFPNDFTEFFDPTNTPEILGYPVLTDGRDKAALSATFDSDGSLSIALLENINLVLTNTPFKLAYRALNELLLSVISHKPQTEIELAAVWDDFLMCKVLPRIEGDIDKLTKGGEDKNILEQLDTLLSNQFKTIWDGEVRPDLYRKSLENDQPIKIECRAKAKLGWMRAQLENGFTSFWP